MPTAVPAIPPALLRTFETILQEQAASPVPFRVTFHVTFAFEPAIAGLPGFPAQPAAMAVTDDHSDDFAWVRHGGLPYSFRGSKQRAAVRLLWQARERGLPGLSQAEILDHPTVEYQGERNRRLQCLFGRHSAWGKLIVHVGGGCYAIP